MNMNSDAQLQLLALLVRNPDQAMNLISSNVAAELENQTGLPDQEKAGIKRITYGRLCTDTRGLH
jgi:hypothetical protein